MKKKPPARVLAISGSAPAEAVVTQARLQEIARLQEAEWLANRAAHKAILELEADLRHGAKVEPGALHFDGELRMVRRRKTG